MELRSIINNQLKIANNDTRSLQCECVGCFETVKNVLYGLDSGKETNYFLCRDHYVIAMRDQLLEVIIRKLISKHGTQTQKNRKE